MPQPNFQSAANLPPIPKTLAEVPDALREIYRQIGVLAARLGTPAEQESDFAEVRRLLHTYTNALQPFCVSPKLRRGSDAGPAGVERHSMPSHCCAPAAYSPKETPHIHQE